MTVTPEIICLKYKGKFCDCITQKILLFEFKVVSAIFDYKVKLSE